jgi:choline dehydrogenase-like flavoprotein
MKPENEPEFQAIVIGTGFAGAVTACRLTEAGVPICVLERGRRYEKDDFPVFPRADIPSVEMDSGPRGMPNPDPYPLFWLLGYGMWDLRDLGELVVAQAAGYGGGSLFYANVHLRPPRRFFDQAWPPEYRGRKLDPYFDLAACMLDVKPYSIDAPKLAKTTQLEAAAVDLGGKCFRPPLAVKFGRPTEEPEENRFGVEQERCELRGDCCFGCGKMAKNTLDLNYLALAERAMKDDRPLASIRTLAEVVSIEQMEDQSFTVEYRDLNTGADDEVQTVTAPWVFLCAGAANSTELLLKSRVTGKLRCTPQEEFGEKFYPNADSIALAFDCKGLQEADRGPTITTAMLYEDEDHWFLFQDGGMPSDLEPFLGVFRSPLWLGRNRFWEQPGPPPSSRPPRIGFATLPFHSLSEQLVHLVPASIQTRSPLLREVAEAAIAISRGLRRPEWLAAREARGAPQPGTSLGSGEEGQGQWSLLPDQLRAALEANRGQFSEHLVAAADPFVTHFLQRTAGLIESMGEKQPKLDELLEELPLPDHFDVRGIQDKERNLAERILRLGVQLVWGSQGEMVRDLAAQLLEFLVPNEGTALEVATDLLRWILDFRISDSRTGMILCMGRDSDPPATLSIELPEPPPIGSIVAERKSSDEKVPGAQQAAIATGILLSVKLCSGSWALHDAAGTLTVAMLSGTFAPGMPLFVGDRLIGVVEREDRLSLKPPASPEGLAEHADACTLEQTTASLELLAIQFKPPNLAPKVRAAIQRNLLRARLRARFGDPKQKPDWSTQERVLRDIVNKCWGGELRTDPISAFMGRRLTVHPQGGCPMGPVTEPDGRVKGCEHLYVMDAAAFPRSVGVNPTATILAVAEYKIEKFIRANVPGKDRWQAKHHGWVEKWIKDTKGLSRETLDPLNHSVSPVKTPGSEPVGIRFTEKMTGLCGRTMKHPDHQVTLDLGAEIEDLAWFLESHERGRFPEIKISGVVTLTPLKSGNPRELSVVESDSHIRLFRRTSDVTDGPEARVIEYRVALDDNGQRYSIEGTKTLRDDEEFDLWKDATRLDFELKQGNTALEEGVLRLTASEFYGGQLPSFEATNTEDPIRQIWALAAFGKLFFGELARIYVPELETLEDTVRCIAERTYV